MLPELSTASCILRNRKITSDNIRIYWDQTPAQVKYFKNLKMNYFNVKKNGENIIITIVEYQK